MQNAAFRVLGLRAVYVALRCAPRDLPGLMRALSRAGRRRQRHGAPQGACRAQSVDRCRETVDRLGACNAFWGENGECVGDNTDVPGVLAALDDLEAPPGGWLLVGTGGGARAAVGAARDRGAPVAVVSRSADRGRRFLEWAAAHGVAAAEPRRVHHRNQHDAAGSRSQGPAAARDAPSGCRGGAGHGLRSRRDRLDPGHAGGRPARRGRSDDAGGAGRGRARALVPGSSGAGGGHAGRCRCPASLRHSRRWNAGCCPPPASCARGRFRRARPTRWCAISAGRAGSR